MRQRKTKLELGYHLYCNNESIKSEMFWFILNITSVMGESILSVTETLSSDILNNILGELFL